VATAGDFTPGGEALAPVIATGNKVKRSAQAEMVHDRHSMLKLSRPTVIERQGNSTLLRCKWFHVVVFSRG